MNAQKSLEIPLRNVFKSAKLNKLVDSSDLKVIVGLEKDMAGLLKKDLADSPDWLAQEIREKKSGRWKVVGSHGPVWLLKVDPKKGKDFSTGRDVVGAFWREQKPAVKSCQLHFLSPGAEFVKGALHGIQLAEYYPGRVYKTENTFKPPKMAVKSQRLRLTPKFMEQVYAFSASMNVSRHLTNLPGGDLHPKSFADSAKKLMSGLKNCKVQVWNKDRLEKEGCGLLLGVGRAGVTPPCLVHIQYRPKSAGKKKPVAFVGKGVTFDTGGLDIKPSQYMRWMKKDMSGAGVVLALAHYVGRMQPKRPFDFYLALAENGVNHEAFRPGDVLVSRNGKTVEIHNTDAEGRLVMADAIDVAVSGKSKPEILVDVSTLTGAMRVALGLEVGGYFATHDGLTKKFEKSAKTVGEPIWRMPLHESYRSDLKSSLADISNCGSSGFAGAITAALFLKEFVGEDIQWGHFDVMAFNHSAKGALSEGGNAQSFQVLADFVLNL